MFYFREKAIIKRTWSLYLAIKIWPPPQHHHSWWNCNWSYLRKALFSVLHEVDITFKRGQPPRLLSLWLLTSLSFLYIIDDPPLLLTHFWTGLFNNIMILLFYFILITNMLTVPQLYMFYKNATKVLVRQWIVLSFSPHKLKLRRSIW